MGGGQREREKRRKDVQGGRGESIRRGVRGRAAVQSGTVTGTVGEPPPPHHAGSLDPASFGP